MRLIGPINSGQTTGGAATSTANADSAGIAIGRVQAIYIKHNGSPPAGTTDVTISTKGTKGYPPSYNFLAIVNAATDGWFYPRVQVDDTAGAPIAGEYTPLMVYDFVNVKIAQANDADSIDVWILLDDYTTEQ